MTFPSRYNSNHRVAVPWGARVLFVAAWVCCATPAFAGDGEEYEWYGWEIMATDAVSVGLLVYGVADDATIPIIGGIAGYALGGAIVHLAHQQWWQSAGSIGLRMGLPFASGMIADVVSDNSTISTVTAMFVGAVVASALDSLLLAWEPAPTPVPAASQPQMLQFQWSF